MGKRVFLLRIPIPKDEDVSAITNALSLSKKDVVKPFINLLTGNLGVSIAFMFERWLKIRQKLKNLDLSKTDIVLVGG